ncbi:MAG: ZIP family metal transporter [Elusimicrobiota bacterium]
MSELLQIITATTLVACLAWIGILTFVLQEKIFKSLLNYLVAFAAGTLLGVSFIHLIPKSLHDLEAVGGHLVGPLIILGGFVFFFILEQYLSWHHCHRVPSEHSKTPFSFMILIANGIHNFVDGLLVGAAFLVNVPLGISTTIAVASHELPQELGNFGILVYGGWNRKKALIVNFAISLIIVPGGIAAYLFSGTINPIYIVPFAAGGFIYIGAADLIPEIQNCNKFKRSIALLGVFLSGNILILLIEILMGH